MRRRTGSWIALIALAIGLSCGTSAKKPTSPGPTRIESPPLVAATERNQIAFVSGRGGAGTLTATVESANAPPPAQIADLSPAETAALLAKLPALPAPPVSAPAMRPTAAPPKRAGTVAPIAFVAPKGKPTAETQPGAVPKVAPPLQAPSIAPTGPVEAEAEVRIRFEDAMVPIAEVDRPIVSAPATISPSVPGTWRWVDTRVAQFTPTSGKFTMATRYTVTVPAGIRGVGGGTLAKAVSETFETEAIKIASRFPSEMLRPDSPVAIELSQAFDPSLVAKYLRVENDKHVTIPHEIIDVATAKARWANHPLIELDKLPAARLLILAPKTAWKPGQLTVVLEANAPSREGPLVRGWPDRAYFDVAAPMRMLGVRCDGDEPRLAGEKCDPGSEISVELSNPIDRDRFKPSFIKIDDQKLEATTAGGSTVSITAPSTGQRAFTVVVDPALTDTFGQAITGRLRATAKTKKEPPEYWPSLEAKGGMYILDPRFTIPQWVVRASVVPRVRIQLYAVQPADMFAFEAFERGKRKTPPGKRVLDRTLEVGGMFGTVARIDLRPALTNGVGHVIAIAEAPRVRTVEGDEQRRIVAWIQVTKLGLVTQLDREHLDAWVSDLTPGHNLAPLAGVTTTLQTSIARTDLPTATSDAEGHAGFDLPPVQPPPPTKKRDVGDDDDDDNYRYGRRSTALVVASRDGDSTFTAIDEYERSVRTHLARWYVTDDRFIYKPGEQAFVKGWVRWTHSGPHPQLAFPAAGERVDYRLADSKGTELAKGTAELTRQGGFDLAITIPSTANLGNARITLKTRDETHSHVISIREFRRPTYAVTLDDDTDFGHARPLVLGEEVTMTVEAKYYSGGGLAGADVQWDARLSPGYYTPPGWREFTFDHPRENDASEDLALEAKHRGTLSSASTASIRYGITSMPNGRPAVLRVDTTIGDVDRARIRASSNGIVVHPSLYYVGLREHPADHQKLDVIVTDPEGHAIAGVPVEIAITGKRESEVHDTQGCRVTSAAAPVTCTWKRNRHEDRELYYTADAKVVDKRGRPNATRYEIPYWSYESSSGDLEIVPDRDTYRVGDVARLEIKSTIFPGTALVTAARQGKVAQWRIALAGASTMFELPIDVAYLPNVHVAVQAWAAMPAIRKRAQRETVPEYRSTQLNLEIEIESARLVVKPRATSTVLAPGGPGTFEVDVTWAGKPVVGAEVALFAVDEAILALTPRGYRDPLPGFFARVGNGLTSTTTLHQVDDAGRELDEQPGDLRVRLDSPEGQLHFAHGMRGGMRGRRAAVPSVSIGQANAAGGNTRIRSDFRPTALWAPRLVTDEHGRATATVTMPDTLTRYRIVAVATAKTYLFGIGESTTATRRNLEVRAVAPRFATQGDTFALPVVVQNLDRQPRTIDVALRAGNLAVKSASAKRITLAAGARAELRFDVATVARGPATIQTIATTGTTTDSTQIEMPVFEPATTESFATYGVVGDKPGFERLEVPAAIYPDVGGVEAELSSTQLQALVDGYWYVQRYPFECAEQRSARMLTAAALGDVIDAFAGNTRVRDAIEATRKADIDALHSAQNSDSGFGYFHRLESDPFVSAQVLRALVAARDSGRDFDDLKRYVDARTSEHLAAIAARAALPETKRPPRTDVEYLVGLAATGLAALAAARHNVHKRAMQLHEAATKLRVYPIDAKARVLALLASHAPAAAARKDLLGALVSATRETASSATVTTSFTEGERLLLGSTTRTNALVLDALLREAPSHSLIPKLARGVLEARVAGRWSTTQENLVVLEAMRKYFDVVETATPSFTGAVWLGSTGYAEQSFVGRTTASALATATWSTLAPGSTHDIAITKSGPGALYYRLGITYAPRSTDLQPLDAGFIVRRSYQAVDSPSDVTRGPDGRWRIKLGAKVLVVVEAVNTSVRYAVALADPLPAGLEPVDAELATSEAAASGTTTAGWDSSELRDHRGAVFSMSLAPGTHRFAYTVRATTPGTFFAAPAKAEEMYHPETFGRSGGASVVVE